ncbi:TMEM175 family protein [Angustibacter luteus]|uniref:TMEM175 family protein n=1 Tax=Angustibacter luteus TaxID=658456 RepID=A0ABW1JKB4_9ACTN
MTTEHETVRERDLDRLLTFVDAVVAIAITLLVLPLVELTSDVTEDDSVRELLHTHSDQLWSFVLSFVVIAQLWSSQHHAVRRMLRADPLVSRLLVVWMFTIVFLPFPTALVATAGQQATTKVLYVGTITVSTLCLALVAVVLGRRPDVTDGVADHDPRPATISAALLLLALGLMLAFPAAGYYPMFLLALFPLFGRAVRIARRAGAQR